MSVSKSRDEYDIPFNFVHFMKFLKDNNILATAIAAILSDRINEITTTFVDYMIMPIINRDGDKDGEKDIKKLEDATFSVYGMEFHVGKVIMALIKFVIITYIIFLIAKSIKKIGEL